MFVTISNIVELRYHNVQSLTNAIVARRSPISDKTTAGDSLGRITVEVERFDRPPVKHLTK
jgi:hypothetical protein